MRLARVLVTALLAAGPVEPSPARYGIELREAKVPMPDGVRLAADLYVPTGGRAGERFPVLLEYLPYRKTEGRRSNASSANSFLERVSTAFPQPELRTWAVNPA